MTQMQSVWSTNTPCGMTKPTSLPKDDSTSPSPLSSTIGSSQLMGLFCVGSRQSRVAPARWKATTAPSDSMPQPATAPISTTVSPVLT